MNVGEENEFNEFKESLAQLDKGLKSMTAMLNKHGRGKVFFGVDDDGNVIGVSVGKETVTKIRTRIKELVEPSFFYQIDTPISPEGKRYVVLEGNGSDTPYSCDGRYFVRNAKSDDGADNVLLRRMLQNREFDLMREADSYTQELTFASFVTFMQGRGLHGHNTRQYFQSCGFFTKEGKYNKVAYLLSDQCPISPRLIVFEGTNKSKMIRKEEFGPGCLLVSVQKGIDYVRALCQTKVDLSNGVRKEIPLFHFESFREAWVNAAVHNDWGQRLPPSVFLYDDRIEIVSYGTIPFGLSEDEFFAGKSLPVNRTLFALFMSARLSEQSGHGMSTIVENYGRESVSLSSEMTTVSFPLNYVRDDVLARKRLKATLTSGQNAVFEYLSAHPESTLQQVADSVGLSLAGVKKIVGGLTESGLLAREGSKKAGKWVVLK